MSKNDREILPQDVLPLHYDLSLEPDFKTFKFNGHLELSLDVVRDTNTVVLNALDMEFGSVSVIIDGKETPANSSNFDEEAQTVTIEFPITLSKSADPVLSIDFIGILNDKMAGFYRSSYKAPDGSKKWLATTQMEPTDARRAFPCFDEPAHKCTFSITLVTDPTLTALSNMDAASEVIKDGKKITTFSKSPLMSTYLVAFVVGDLKYVESDLFRIPVRVYTPPGMEERGHFSAELAAKTLAFFEKTFDMPFPLPKMDMVAIPDFSAGAMENWGLITYRVVDLLFDEKTDGAATKERVAEVVQHELAHQWFGNLVTMDWWEGLWLNEGFATWMSWFSCNNFYPDWKVWQNYVVDNLQSALSLDGLRSSHPIEVPVKKADEINQIFDAISYSKGSCVLRMISKFLGEDTFIKGIQIYLKRHKYGNTETADLWNALSEASGKDVSHIMDIWTKQVGFPVITVEEDGTKVTFRQNRFLNSGDVKPEEDRTLYPVFLGIRTKSSVMEDLTLDSREITLDLGSDIDFYKVNADQSGIFRTSYPPSRLAKLGANPQLLSVEDRAGLVADAGALASSGYQKTSGLLSLVSQWQDETEFVVWQEMLSRIALIRNAWIFESPDIADSIKILQRELTAPMAHKMGWSFSETDGHVESQLKALLFSVAGHAGDETIIASALDMFDKYSKGDKSAIHPNIKGAVFGIAVKELGAPAWDVLLETIMNPISTDEKNTAYRNLGRSNDPELIKKTIDLLFNDTIVKPQDIYLPMAGLRTHKEGIVALWKWTKNNWDEIVRLLPPGLSMLSSVVSVTTSGYATPAGLAEIEKFFKNKPTKGFDQGLAQSLESVRSKLSWVKRDTSDVKKWLKESGFYSKDSTRL
ncbi:hypothetical protein CANCADRAFT_57016 [Tortispora caseinolytica NRRL Y-17796]|uniref:Aminopeptidase n=1 Tax=Tortispora caseinolytica NRRL Y-17796 TaxID=767744 RepID=A0A1E4TFN6_9ASCO|nr:hypothetical protein CANCADRAFT_57016 [Tortispora caseinolytica NRRL Y-17796]